MNDEKDFNFDIISVIMKKKVFFALICACVIGFAASSCSSDKSDEPVYDTGEIYRVYTDYISDINDEYGVIHGDYYASHMYIEVANGNRYYFLPRTEVPVFDIESCFEVLGFADGDKVKFSGKVYDSDERWIPGLQWRLDNYGWNDYAKEAASNGLYNYELPTAGHTFWLVAPDFTITKAE